MTDEEANAKQRARAAKMRRKRGAVKREPAACGTVSGYKRHKREGTPVCDACLAANRAASNAGAARRRAARDAEWSRLCRSVEKRGES